MKVCLKLYCEADTEAEIIFLWLPLILSSLILVYILFFIY